MGLRGIRVAFLAAAVVLPAISFAAGPSNAHGPARGTAADSHAVEQMEQRWIADIQRGDRADLAMLLADDYRDIDWQGRVRDKQALLAAVAKPGHASQHITRLRVRTWGDTATATGINEVRSAARGSVVEIAFTDVFARIGGQWRAVSSQETLRRPAKSGGS